MMKIMKRVAVALLVSALAQPVFADWKDSLDNAWDNTKDIGGSTLNKTKDLVSTLSGDVRLVTREDRVIITPQEIINEKSDHLQEIWPDVLEKLDDALELNTKIDAAPESAWFSADKNSLSKKQFDIFSVIEALFENPAISKNRKNIEKLNKKVKKERKKIALLREKRIVSIGDDKQDLDDDIKKAQANILAYEENINFQKDDLRIRLQGMGLSLSNKQIDVLLSRVDSDDIIKMSMVYDVLADITKQLMELTQEFNEDINQARKYYGMHVVLLKMVITMQDSYINKIENAYLPKIAKIRDETLQVNQESKSLLRSEKNASQQRVLRNNIKAQQLTLKVAKLYSQQLQKQKKKVVSAMIKAQKDYRVAKNTFDTVKLSAELIRLMKTNQASFNALMNIQIPEIVPFKNLEMQKKFEELSLLLKG